MQFNLDFRDLKGALATNGSLVGNLSFDNCALNAEKDRLTIFSKSDSCWVKSIIPAKVAKKGQVFTNVAVLASLKLSGKDSEFIYSEKESKLNFKSGKSKGYLQTTISENDVTKPDSNIPLQHKVSLVEVKELIDAMNYDSDVVEVVKVKPISLRSDGKFLRMSTHDSYCLGYAEVKTKNKEKFEILAPFDLISTLVSSFDTDFEIGIKDGYFRVKSETLDIVRRFEKPEKELVDMDKQIEDIKKEKASTNIEVSAEEVSKVLQEVISFSFDQTSETKVNLEVNAEKNKVDLEVSTTHGGFKSSFKAEKISKNLKAKVSLWLFASFLEKIKKDVTISIYANKLMVFDGRRYYIMPLTK